MPKRIPEEHLRAIEDVVRLYPGGRTTQQIREALAVAQKDVAGAGISFQDNRTASGFQSFWSEVAECYSICAIGIPVSGGYAASNFRTLIFPCRCCSQLSGLPPKPCDWRIAMSGDIPRRWLSNKERVLRDTPSPFAASVTVSFRKARHCRSINWPGCGGSCIGMGSPLTVVQVVDIDGMACLEAENHPPVGP